MSARNGKIARLPRTVRDELNRRLECSDESPELLDWLNALPEVQAVLKEHFDGTPINKQNLSAWRAGGFQEALARRDLAQDAQDLAEWSKGMNVPAIDDELADHAAVALAVRLGALVAHWNGEVDEQFSAKAKIFAILGRTVTQLQRQIHQSRRDKADFKAEAEKQEKGKIKASRTRAFRRIVDDEQAFSMSKSPGGGGFEGYQMTAHLMAIQRGDCDDELNTELSPDKRPWSVKVGKGDLERILAKRATSPDAAKAEQSGPV